MRHFERLRDELRSLMPVYLSLHWTRATAPELPYPPDFVVSAEDGAALLPVRHARMAEAGSYIPAYTDLTHIPALLSDDLKAYEHLWLIEYDVDFTGPWSRLFEWASGSNADLIGSGLARRANCSGWVHWPRFSCPPEISDENVMKGFFPLARFSRRFLDLYPDAVRDPQWAGITEALYPTIALHHGLKVETLEANALSSDVPSLPCVPGRSPFVGRATHNVSLQRSAYFHEAPQAFLRRNQLYHPVKVPEVRPPLDEPASAHRTQAQKRAAIKRPTVTTPAIALVANHLIVAFRTAESEPVTEVELVGANRTPATIIGECRSPSADAPSRSAAEITLLACQLSFDDAKAVAAMKGPQEVHLRSGDGVLEETHVAIQSFEESGLREHADGLRALCDEIAARSPELAPLLLSLLADQHLSPTVDCRLSANLVVPDRGFVAAGHAASTGERNVLFLLDDLKLAINPERIFVDAPSATNGASDFGADFRPSHSFACIDAIAGSSHRLRLAAISGAEIAWSHELLLAEQGDPRQFLRTLARFVPARDLVARPGVAAMVRGMAVQPRVTVTPMDYLKGESKPDLSLVIPFYQDDFFLLDQLESQRRTDANAEWIVVCDDPAIARRMQDTCRVRRGTLTKATTLLSLSHNVGFAAACNIGFRQAIGDYVVFTNSDIYWRSFAPFEFGMRLLRDDASIGAVGFVLHYEDGTLQHAGMELQVTPELDDLILLEHPLKGLPAPDYGAEITAREVEAVTGALMMVRRGDFNGAVFDEGYVGGDFEDGDLCLQLRSRGKRIVLVECAGIYHLERQSISEGAQQSFTTTLNCARFNERWGAYGLGGA